MNTTTKALEAAATATDPRDIFSYYAPLACVGRTILRSIETLRIDRDLFRIARAAHVDFNEAVEYIGREVTK